MIKNSETEITRPSNELHQKLEEILRQEIASDFQIDGTELEVVDIQDGIAQIRFGGICSSCPSSLITLIHGLEQVIRQRLPEIEFIEAVN